MNAKECDWENKNQMLQKELRDTLRSALEDTESEEHSLTSLEQVTVLRYSDGIVVRESMKMYFKMYSKELKRYPSNNILVRIRYPYQQSYYFHFRKSIVFERSLI